MSVKKRVGVLISGRGSNLVSLIEAGEPAGFSGGDRARHL